MAGNYATGAQGQQVGFTPGSGYVDVNNAPTYATNTPIQYGPNYTGGGSSASGENTAETGSTPAETGNTSTEANAGGAQNYQSTAPAVTNTTPQQQSAPKTYTVAQGNTLSGIASQFGTNIQALMAANPSITNPNKISTGAVLNLPNAPQANLPNNPANNYQAAVHTAVSAVPDQNNAAAVSQAASTIAAPGESPLPDSAQNNLQTLIANSIQTTQQYQQQTQANFIDGTNKILGDQNAITADQASLMNINTLMNGTANDIRTEVTKAGGFMSESQVQALTATRNQSMIQQANLIQNNLSIAQQQLSNDQTLNQQQQDYATTQYQTATNENNTLISLGQSAQSIATQQYTAIYNKQGPQELANMAAGNPYLQGVIENAMGFAPGTLSLGSPQLAAANASFLPYLTEQNAALTANANASKVSYYVQRGQLAQVQGSQAIGSSYANSPVYKGMLNAGSDIDIINTAEQNPSSVTDPQLVSAINGLVTNAEGLSSEQISSITGGKSLSDYASILTGKLTSKGGFVSPTQRTEATTFAQNLVTAMNSQLNSLYTGTQSNYANTPYTFEQSGYYTPAELQAGVKTANAKNANQVTIGGNSYTVGTPLQAGGVTYTPESDGTFTGSDGNIYSVDDSGNLVQEQ